MEPNSFIYSPKLLFTPRLKQAISIIEMTSQELFEFILGQLEENPVLEFKKNERSPYENSYIIDVDQLNEYDFLEEHVKDANNCSPNILFDLYSSRISLKEYMLFQLHISRVEKGHNAIAEYLIDNIDANGYLNIDLTDVAAYFNVSIKRVNAVLKHLQTFDPPGICSRNLQECLKIQLRNSQYMSRDIFNIVDNHLSDVANDRYEAAAKKTGLSMERIQEIFGIIKKLEPKPGREFSNIEDTRYIVADLIVNRANVNVRYTAKVNKDAIPELCINKFYKNLMYEEMDTNSKKFLTNKINSAVWIIKCLQFRKQALTKIADYIVREQNAFFSYGRKHIKPLDFEKSIEKVDLSGFIFLKLLKGKYLQCTWGYFELKHFFNLFGCETKLAGY